MTTTAFKLAFLLIALGVCPVASASLTPATAPYASGETIHYAIKQTGVKVGDATLVYQGETRREGQTYALIVFTARGFNFYDEERIFVDPRTLLPQVVMRDLNIFGSKEKIMEEYDQKAGTIKVTKLAKGTTSIQILQKEGAIDNIYGFIYRYRSLAEAARKDARFDMRLPTKDIVMSAVACMDFDAAGRKYRAELIRSVPSKYSIWMDTGEKRLPLRIAGAIGIANTVMTMVDYQEAPLP